MTKERLYLFDTTLRCPPCPQVRSIEDRQYKYQPSRRHHGEFHD